MSMEDPFRLSGHGRSVIIVLAVSAVAGAAAYSILHVAGHLPRNDGQWLPVDQRFPTPMLVRGLFSLTKELVEIAIATFLGRKVLHLRL